MTYSIITMGTSTRLMFIVCAALSISKAIAQDNSTWVSSLTCDGQIYNIEITFPANLTEGNIAGFMVVSKLSGAILGTFQLSGTVSNNQGTFIGSEVNMNASAPLYNHVTLRMVIEADTGNEINITLTRFLETCSISKPILVLSKREVTTVRVSTAPIVRATETTMVPLSHSTATTVTDKTEQRGKTTESTAHLGISTSAPGRPRQEPVISQNIKNINIGAIVGGVLAGLAAIVIVILLICILRKRRQNRGDPASPIADDNRLDTLEPRDRQPIAFTNAAYSPKTIEHMTSNHNNDRINGNDYVDITKPNGKNTTGKSIKTNDMLYSTVETRPSQNKQETLNRDNTVDEYADTEDPTVPNKVWGDDLYSQLGNANPDTEMASQDESSKQDAIDKVVMMDNDIYNTSEMPSQAMSGSQNNTGAIDEQNEVMLDNDIYNTQ